jgi:hypothetical protein
VVSLDARPSDALAPRFGLTEPLCNLAIGLVCSFDRYVA